MANNIDPAIAYNKTDLFAIKNKQELDVGFSVRRYKRAPIEENSVMPDTTYLAYEMKSPNSSIYKGQIVVAQDSETNDIAYYSPWLIKNKTNSNTTYFADRIMTASYTEQFLEGRYVRKTQLGTEYTGVGQWSDVKGIEEKTSTYSEVFNDYSYNIIPIHENDDKTQPYLVYSHAEGANNKVYKSYSHAEGLNNTVNGSVSHAEGQGNYADGDYSHVEGYNNIASGAYSHAQGDNSKALGQSSFASGDWVTSEGEGSTALGSHTKAVGNYSVATGNVTIAQGTASFAEGNNTKAIGDYTHAEGRDTIANGVSSHVEGYKSESNGDYSHAEGYNVKAIGKYSHAEGVESFSYSEGSHVEGKAQIKTDKSSYSHAEGAAQIETGEYSHAEGNAVLSGDYSHAEGYSTVNGNYAHGEGNAIATGMYTHAEGKGKAIAEGAHAEGDSTASGEYSHGEGNGNTASGDYSHAEGISNEASGKYSHAEGNTTQALGESSHTEGKLTKANEGSHAEGFTTYALGRMSHTEGNTTQANSDYSHAEGDNTRVDGTASHVEGSFVTVTGNYSHGEGLSTTASGNYSHVEGNTSIAKGEGSHAEGTFTGSYGTGAHTEGYGSNGQGNYSHTEGYFGIATQDATYAHVEGFMTSAYGIASHTEGYNTHARGNYTHVSGFNTLASNTAEFSAGSWNRAYTTSSIEGEKISEVPNEFARLGGKYVAGRYPAGKPAADGTYYYDSSYETIFSIGNGSTGDTSKGPNPLAVTDGKDAGQYVKEHSRHNVMDIRKNGQMYYDGGMIVGGEIVAPMSYSYVASLGPTAYFTTIMAALLTQPEYYRPTMTVNFNGSRNFNAGATFTVEVGTTINYNLSFKGNRVAYDCQQHLDPIYGTVLGNMLGYTKGITEITYQLCPNSYVASATQNANLKNCKITIDKREDNQFLGYLGGSLNLGKPLGGGKTDMFAYNPSGAVRTTPTYTSVLGKGLVIGTEDTYTLLKTTSYTWSGASQMYFQQLAEKGTYIGAAGTKPTEKWDNNEKYTCNVNTDVQGRYKMYWGTTQKTCKEIQIAHDKGDYNNGWDGLVKGQNRYQYNSDWLNYKGGNNSINDIDNQTLTTSVNTIWVAFPAMLYGSCKSSKASRNYIYYTNKLGTVGLDTGITNYSDLLKGPLQGGSCPLYTYLTHGPIGQCGMIYRVIAFTNRNKTVGDGTDTKYGLSIIRKVAHQADHDFSKDNPLTQYLYDRNGNAQNQNIG